MLRAGSFREDLYYRLNVFSLQIPPLRERVEDVPLIVEYYIRNSAIVPKRKLAVSDEAMAILKRYPWPGNARELENVVERALILCDSGAITPEHLPIGVRLGPVGDGSESSSKRPTLEEVERRYIRQVLDDCKGHRQNAARILGISERNLYRKLKEIEAG
jgi:DNA-binding NtrC family response regulator